MQIKDLDNKMIAVVGFGVEGKSVVKYLVAKGLKPVLFDQLPWNLWPTEEQEFIKNLSLNFIFGPQAFLELKGFDVVFRSPGIKLSQIKKNISPNTIITSQTKWFFDNCPAEIIGVTGTKGKGTTSTLIYEILKNDSSKIKSYLTGNIGKIQPLEILDNLTQADKVVYELSSFQLQDLTKSPKIGVVLMVTSEHLDYHQDLEEYHLAKSSIVKFQTESDTAIINGDFPASVKIGALSAGKKIYFGKQKQPNFSCYVLNNKVIYKNETGLEEEVLNIKDLQLKGEHNWENICASICVAKAIGIDSKTIRNATVSFKGLEHRLEFVVEKNGIKFYNDSFSTTPETAIAAVKSFSEPEIIILGGSVKNSDFTELAKCISQTKNVKAVILIGQESENIKKAILATKQFSGQIYEGALNMNEIFEQIKNCAESGDLVILSPACASFGMFKNYKDRGEQFKKMAITYK